MQSYCDVPDIGAKRFSIAEINRQLEEKENCSPVCPQQNKKVLQKMTPKDPQKSKLPVLCKSRQPPDFQKLHQTWQSRFQKGKALSKKSCTRPQPFNFSQKGERSQAQTVTDPGICGTSLSGQLPWNQPASLKTREPLAEVVLEKNHKESNEGKGVSEVKFKADPVALASILSNKGVPTAPVGKVSLAQRVPIRAASMTYPHNTNRNVMVRNSMYSLPSNRMLSAHLDRMSIVEADNQKPLFGHQMSVPHATVKEAAYSKKDDKLHPQENPLLQQMNHPSFAVKELCVEKPKSCPVFDRKSSAAISTGLYDKSLAEIDSSAAKNDSAKQPDAGSGHFVADSQALANILSNTEMNIANCGKLSLAQRVPMQGRKSFLKGTMILSGTPLFGSATPKPTHGPASVNASLKDVTFSPCRIPNTILSRDNNSGGSARRILQTKPSAVKFSQPYSLTSNQVFFKTPRALALENANKLHLAECTPFQTLRKTTPKSFVKWKDEPSPSPDSEVLCENEPDLEQVAVRLFLDVECPEGSGKKKEPTATEPQQQTLTLAENCNKNGPRPDVEISSYLQLHNNLPPAPSQQNDHDPSCGIDVPLSFLSHPAVKALQSCTLGPCSLPDITRLRLQAAVSAKQRFWEARLDEECAFYTSQGTIGSCRSCTDPVAINLDRQEDMHFTPISPGESSAELSIAESSLHLHSPEIELSFGS